LPLTTRKKASSFAVGSCSKTFIVFVNSFWERRKQRERKKNRGRRKKTEGEERKTESDKKEKGEQKHKRKQKTGRRLEVEK
jgi:hypothetical protein